MDDDKVDALLYDPSRDCLVAVGTSDQPLCALKGSPMLTGSKTVALTLFVVVLISPLVSWACPSCPTSRLVRAIVCGEEWPRHLAITVAPFVTFAVIAWVLLRGGEPPPSRLHPKRPSLQERP